VRLRYLVVVGKEPVFGADLVDYRWHLALSRSGAVLALLEVLEIHSAQVT